jgi:hypothetical protein
MPVSPSSCIFCQIGSSESSACRPSRIRICTAAERACRCASQREVEHRLGQRGLGAEPLVDALGRDAGLRGDGGDRGRPVAVALELLARREHHGQPPGAGLRAPPIIEHWANRDDLGMARQLGWIPPSPAFLFKMARAKRRALRTPAR